MIYILSYIFYISAFLFSLSLKIKFKMKLTTDEKNFIVKKYTILGSPVLVQRAWRTKYVCKYAPNGSTITAIVKKFDKTGAVHNLIRKNKEPSQKRKNAKPKLKMVISEDPSLSIRQIS